MGRYYEGDIEGKFWFGVQSSDDGEFFGAEAQESNYIDYYVDKEKFIESKGMRDCKKALTFTHKGKKYKWYELHDKWNFTIDEWMEKNKDNDERWNYPQFGAWLKEKYDYGNGLDTMEGQAANGLVPIYEWLARYSIGRKMEQFFKDNPDRDDLYFNAEC